MRQINLLPTELKPSRKINIALKRIEKISIVFIITYLLILGILFGTVYYLNNIQNQMQLDKSALSAELKSLSAVETSTVYIRDRVSKFLSLKDKDVEKKGLDAIDDLSKKLPANVEISDIKISENNLSFSAVALNSYALSSFLEEVIESGVFLDASLEELSFSEGEGYSFNMRLIY